MNTGCWLLPAGTGQKEAKHTLFRVHILVKSLFNPSKCKNDFMSVQSKQMRFRKNLRKISLLKFNCNFTTFYAETTITKSFLSLFPLTLLCYLNIAVFNCVVSMNECDKCELEVRKIMPRQHDFPLCSLYEFMNQWWLSRASSFNESLWISFAEWAELNSSEKLPNQHQVQWSQYHYKLYMQPNNLFIIGLMAQSDSKSQSDWTWSELKFYFDWRGWCRP